MSRSWTTDNGQRTKECEDRARILETEFAKTPKTFSADLPMKMASNKKMQENKPTLKFNFTIEKR